MTDDPHQAAVIAVSGASKSFGAVRALDDVTFSVHAGECVGVIGHNGAGKSTLMTVINGLLSLDRGDISLHGKPVSRHSIASARANGLRCVFQELSLCPNLTVVENTRIMHPSLKGWGWRKKSAQIISSKLEEIFPDNGIDCMSAIGDLTIAQRQMVEIATAFTETEHPVRLVILDEPTSSLDATLAEQLLAYVRRFIAGGGAVIFISHILGEVLSICNRIAVMKDGHVTHDQPASDFTEEGLVNAMGSVVKAKLDRRAASSDNASSQTPVLTARKTSKFKVRPGEVLGLAGLGGHGQTKMLVDLFLDNSSNWLASRDPKVTFVAGDRLTDGVFPLWSILRNTTISLLPRLTRKGLVQTGEEHAIAEDWRKRISIRTPDMDNNILSLSGGNQQKALFARALATTAPVVLMDDPMRGVDVGTKQDVYAMVRQEAEKGRSFVWYSTEMSEVCLCDRVYVFLEGEIVAELSGDDVNEHNILAASFTGVSQ